MILKFGLKKKIVWQVSREYAGIAEAGGVKNVACSLAEGLVKQGFHVTQFIPLYGFVPAKTALKARHIKNCTAKIACNAKTYTVTYKETYINGVHIVFTVHDIFFQKRAVYTYTPQDEHENPAHKRGTGHLDTNEMNVIFQKAVLAYAEFNSIAPNVLQCQDAHTALLPALIHTHQETQKLFAHTKNVVTIHNAGAGYHQHFESVETAHSYTGLPVDVLKNALCNGKIEPFLAAAQYAQLTTVSPWYAQELADPQNQFSAGLANAFAERKTHIIGITNGIDFERYNTKRKTSCLTHFYNPQKGDLKGKYKVRIDFLKAVKEHYFTIISKLEQYGSIQEVSNAVYFSYHGRIAEQKGLDVLAKAIPLVLQKIPEARFIIIGQGSSEIEQLQINAAHENGGKCIYFRGYERAAARTCVAASDFLVLPSIFEPCGLEDFIGQIFGTIPVAHAVGGLQKIIHQETGFLYKTNTPEHLAHVLIDLAQQKQSNPHCFDSLIQNAANYVYNTYSWKKVIKNHYKKLYGF